MDPTIAAAALLVAAALAVHLWADARGRPAARAAGKAVASAGFLLAAAPRFSPDRARVLVLAALVLSAVGDLCLLGRGRRTFLAGVGAFLLAHVGYAAAFAPGARPAPAVAAALCVVALAALGWLWPHLGTLRAAVAAYVAAISAMALVASGSGRPVVQLAAGLFYASDLAVARDRFVAPGLTNRVIGLPLYYAAQLLFAASL